MSMSWDDDVYAAFGRLWPAIHETLKPHMQKCLSSEHVEERHRVMLFQAITVWARQYAFLMLETPSSKKPNQLIFPVANRKELLHLGVTDPRFLCGIDPLKLAARARSVMQLHQERVHCTLAPPRPRQGSDCMVNVEESAMQLRGRLARVSYYMERVDDCSTFVEYVESHTSAIVFDATHEGLPGVDGGLTRAGTTIWINVVHELTSADAVGNTVPTRLSCTHDVRALTSLQDKLKELRTQACAEEHVPLTTPCGAQRAKEELRVDTLREDDLRRRVVRHMVTARRRLFELVGYTFVGRRDGVDGDRWFKRRMRLDDSSACDFMKQVGADLTNYEVRHALRLRLHFMDLAKKYCNTKDQSIIRNTLEHYPHLHHLEEAKRCATGARPQRSAVDAPDRRDHQSDVLDDHVPTLRQRSIDTLATFAETTVGFLPPREKMVKREKLFHCGMCETKFPLGHFGPVLDACDDAKEVTPDVVNAAALRVIAIMDWASNHAKRCFVCMVITLMKMLQKHKETMDAVHVVNSFVSKSADYWDRARRSRRHTNLVEVFSCYDDALLLVMTHTTDVRSLISMACTCKLFYKTDILRASLPTIKTAIPVGSGWAGTLDVPGDPPRIRTNTLIHVYTSFGYTRPSLDGKGEWHELDMREYMPKDTSVTGKVELVYDEPERTSVHRAHQAVMRMGSNTGNKLTGTFLTIAGCQFITPIKILIPSHSVKNNFRSNYDSSVLYWNKQYEDDASSLSLRQRTLFTDMRRRNKNQQCFRLKVTFSCGGLTRCTETEPFIAVANLNRVRKKQKLK